MLDLFSLLRGALSQGCGKLTGENILFEDIRPAARKFGAKSAFALRLGLQAEQTAASIHKKRADFTLWDMPLVEAVYSNGGHILFCFTDCFYDEAVKRLLGELPRVGALPLPKHVNDALFKTSAPRGLISSYDGVCDRLLYVQRRMWMLSRHCKGDIRCANEHNARHAFLLTAGLNDGMCKRVKKRLLDCLDFLLYMTNFQSPGSRRKTLSDCAYIAAVASSVLYDLYYHQKGRF